MIASEDLKAAPIFAALQLRAQQEFAAKAADIRLNEEKYVVHDVASSVGEGSLAVSLIHEYLSLSL